MTSTLAPSRRTELALPNRLPDMQTVVEAPPTRTRGIVVMLVLAAAFFWLGLGSWAAVATLQSAVVASGVFRVEGNVPVVQHLEGGLIRRVYVREGEQVAAGQVLVELADTLSAAQDRILANQLVNALAQDRRLMAEARGVDELEASDELANLVASDQTFAEIVQTQRDLLVSNNGVWKGQLSILDDRMAEQENQLSGLTSRLRSQQRRLELVRDELTDLEALFKQGLITKTRLLDRRDAEIALLGDMDFVESQIEGLRQRMSETRERKLQVQRDRASRASDEQQKVKALLFDTRQRIIANRDVKERQLIRAPAAGRVMDLRFTATGEVIQDGEEIMKIVPDGATYVVEGQVRPEDVDQVAEGDTARVRLTAYNFRTTPAVEGVVTHVSADSFTDGATGRAFFKVNVRVDEAELATLDNVVVAPGMPAQVMITTGAQTVANYLLGPLVAGLETAMRESD